MRPDYVVPHFPDTAGIVGLPLPMPPTLTKQREIVAVLDEIDCKKGLHRRKFALLDALFRALLHQSNDGKDTKGGALPWGEALWRYSGDCSG